MPALSRASVLYKLEIWDLLARYPFYPVLYFQMTGEAALSYSIGEDTKVDRCLSTLLGCVFMKSSEEGKYYD